MQREDISLLEWANNFVKSILKKIKKNEYAKKIAKEIHKDITKLIKEQVKEIEEQKNKDKSVVLLSNFGIRVDGASDERIEKLKQDIEKSEIKIGLLNKVRKKLKEDMLIKGIEENLQDENKIKKYIEVSIGMYFMEEINKSTKEKKIDNTKLYIGLGESIDKNFEGRKFESYYNKRYNDILKEIPEHIDSSEKQMNESKANLNTLKQGNKGGISWRKIVGDSTKSSKENKKQKSKEVPFQK